MANTVDLDLSGAVWSGSIILQMGHVTSGNFKIHISVYSGDFIVTSRETG